MLTFVMGRKRSVVMPALVAVVVAFMALIPNVPGSNLFATSSAFAREVAGQRETPGQRDAFVLAVGVSNLSERVYGRGGDNLVGARDARDQFDLLKGMEGSMFHKVDGRLLQNSDATQEHFRSAFKEIEDQARPNLTVFVNLNDHGGIDRLTGEWIFCAYDGVIYAHEFRDFATRVASKGALVIFIIEACHSGALTIDVDNVVILASSCADQNSWDGSPMLLHDHSLFCRALFEALSGKADTNGDGIVTLAEVMEYLKKRIPELTKALDLTEQNPSFQFRGVTPEDVPLAKVGGSRTGGPTPTRTPTPTPTPTGPIGR